MTDCLHSMAPSKEELLGFTMDGEPLQEGSARHLEQCTICQQRLATYKHTNDALLSRLYRSHCPSAARLNYYCANLLSSDEASAIAEHIALCPLCTAEVVTVKQVLANFDPFPETEPLSPGATLQRIIANLVPWKPQLVTRSATSPNASWPRQYRAGDLHISLHLSRSSNGETMLLGLVSSNNPRENVENFEGIQVDLYHTPVPEPGHEHEENHNQQSSPCMRTQIDDLGNIVFKAVPIGVYTMLIRMPDMEIVIEPLTLEHG